MSSRQKDRSVVLAPGGNSNTDVPLLMYARMAAERRGASVIRVQWDIAAGAGVSGQRDMVLSKVTAAIEESAATTKTAPLVIAKSLGSLAAPVVADRGLAAIWFTPLLTDEPTVAALRRCQSPCLLVGGTADPYWDGRIARSVCADVLEIDRADHTMCVPGPLSASAAVLGQVMTAVEDFLDDTAWR